MVIITKKNLKPRHENDAYNTPYDLAKAIVNKYAFVGIHRHVLDPGCGHGVFGRALKDKGDASFYVAGIDNKTAPTNTVYDHFVQDDYLLSDNIPSWHNGFDLIIGNPPYEFAEEFIRKSFQYLNSSNPYASIVFLLKIAFLNSAKRGKGLFVDHKLAHVDALMQRPSFYGNGKTNDYDFGVFVWRPYEANIRFGTQLGWLDWR